MLSPSFPDPDGKDAEPAPQPKRKVMYYVRTMPKILLAVRSPAFVVKAAGSGIPEIKTILSGSSFGVSDET